MDIEYLGDWSQNIVIGLLTGLISGIFVSLLFTLTSNPSQIGTIEPYLIGFAAFIAIVLVINVIIQCYREKVNKESGESPKLGTPPKRIRVPFIFDIVGIIVILIIVGIGTFYVPTIFISPLVGAIVGALIALLSSHLMFQMKQYNELKTISRAFYVELESYQDWMNSWISDIELAKDTLMVKELLDVTLFSTVNRPFIDSNSLYTLRKEMYLFDKKTSEKLFRIYSLIKGAEESRQIVISNKNEHFNPVVQKTRLEHIKQNFQYALKLIDEIKREFDQM